jgi:Na+/proline symporter
VGDRGLHHHAETSTITFISVPGIAYSRGGDLTFLQLPMGYMVGRIAISILFIPLYFKGELLTVYQLLTERFGRGVKALAASLFVTMRTVGDGIRLLLMSIVLGTVKAAFLTGLRAEDAVPVAIIVLGVVMILFTLWGGMEAVIWIEVVQLGIYLTGAIAAAVILASKVEGGLGGALALAATHHKLRLFDFSVRGRGSYATFWAGVVGGGSRDVHTAPTSTSCSASASEGLGGAALVGRLRAPPVRSSSRSGSSSSRSTGFEAAGYATGPATAPVLRGDGVFPDFITHHLPSPLPGLVVAAILAAALSSSLNAIAATAVNDLYRPLRPNRDDAHYLSLGKRLTVAAGILQILVALALRTSDSSALDKALAVASLLNGPVLGVFLLGFFTKAAGPRAALLGMSAGLALNLWLRFGTSMPWPWLAAIGSLTTLIVGTLAGRLRPEDAPRP